MPTSNRQHHPATAPTSMRGPREYPPAPPAKRDGLPLSMQTTPEQRDRAARALAARHAAHERTRPNV